MRKKSASVPVRRDRGNASPVAITFPEVGWRGPPVERKGFSRKIFEPENAKELCLARKGADK